jgi:ankyrin repeat protein
MIKTNSVDLHYTTPEGWTPLMYAIYHSYSEIVEAILNSDPSTLDDQREDKNNIIRTPLIIAAENANQKTFEFVVSKASIIQINQVNNLGITALQVAVKKKDKSKCNVLLEHGADPNQADNEGKTPLWFSVYFKNYDIAQLLVQHKANVNKYLPCPSAPLHIAAGHGDLKLAGLLLENGADINIHLRTDSNDPATPICYSAKNKQHAMLDYLIKCDGLDVNVGYNPLSFATQEGDLNSVKILVKAGYSFNLNIVSQENFVVKDVPILMALSNIPILEFFLSQDNFESVTYQGNSLEVIFALQRGNTLALELLLANRKIEITDSIIDISSATYDIDDNPTIPILKRRLEADRQKEIDQATTSEDDEIIAPAEETPTSEASIQSSEEGKISDDDEIVEPAEETPAPEALIQPTPVLRNSIVSLPPLRVSISEQVREFQTLINMFFNLRNRNIPIQFDMHSSTRVEPVGFVQSVMEEINEALKMMSYNGSVILIPGQGQHSQIRRFSLVKRALIDYAITNNISYQEHLTNPGRVIFQYQNGEPVIIERAEAA